MNTTPHLEQLAPGLLTTDRNVRKDLDLTKPFLDSIKTNGVLQPIVAYPDPLLDGQYRIHMGHRRAAAAVTAGLTVVPVYIITERLAAEEIAEQLSENIHRSSLTVADQVGAYQDMALFGMSAMAIAKRTSTKLAIVGDALKVSKSPATVAALTSYQLTLDQAIKLVEFEDDPDAVEQLTGVAARGGNLDHLAQQLRDKRDDEAARSICVDAIKASGIIMLDASPSYDDSTMQRLANVFTGPKLSTRLTEATALAEAGADLRAYPKKVWGEWVGDTRGPSSYEIGYAVTNWTAHGWYTHGGAVKTPITDEIRAERKQAKVDKTDWMSASVVREEWIRNTLLPATGHTSISITNTLIAQHFVGELFAPNYSHHIDTAANWLGAVRESGEYGRSPLQKWLAQNPTKPRVLSLAIALAGMEDVIAAPKGDTKGWDDNRGKVGPYLEQLQHLGYTLSDIEQSVVDADQARAAAKAAKAVAA